MKDEKKFFNPLNIVIIIFGVVFLAAFFYTGYITLTNMKAEDKYEDLVKVVEEKALKWAEDREISEVMHISVERLIIDGYIEAENEEGELLNPRLRERTMNCHTIYVEPYNDGYKIMFNEEVDCNLVQFEKLGISLKAETISGKKVETGEWESENIILSLLSNIDIENITWYQDGNLLEEYNGFKQININTVNILVSTFTVNFSVYEEIYNINFDIKIDKSKVESTN